MKREATFSMKREAIDRCQFPLEELAKSVESETQVGQMARVCKVLLSNHPSRLSRQPAEAGNLFLFIAEAHRADT